MDYGLRGRVALITGAASGIGRATAKLFAEMGARVVASDRDPHGGEALEFVPMGRMGRPDEVANAIARLCSDAASFVTGEALAIEGGLLAR